MSQPLSERANQLWKTVSEPDTAKTYKSTLALSWKILKDFAHLIWLALCSVIVIVDWSSRNSTRLINWVKKNIQNFQARSSEELASDAKQALLSVSQDALHKTVVTARKELGLPTESNVIPQLNAAIEGDIEETAKVTSVEKITH